MIKTSVICIGLVILVLGALPFGANAAQSNNADDGLVVVSLGSKAETVTNESVIRYTTIRVNGDMAGVDKNGDHWTYDSDGSRYHNLSTGKVCFGNEARNHCNGDSIEITTLR